jgi:succinoglycan biosynthesis transport protein ExoP
MDQDIDLREYIAALLKHKFWIAGLAVGAAVVALVVSLLLPPTYRATALVVVTRQKYEMQFDPRFALVGGNVVPPYKAYPLLAMGDELLADLIADMGPELSPGRRTVENLRAKLAAETGADPSVIRLSVEDGDPQRAAAVANRWAEHFVEKANDLYAPRKDEQSFYEGQQTEAEGALAQAERELIDFQASNEALILSVQLEDKRLALEEYLGVARSVALVAQDAQSLSDRLRTQDEGTLASSSDELTALLLEIDALNRSELPVQLQVSVQQDLGGKTVGDQIAFLDSLIRVLEDRQVVLEREAKALEPDILGLQEQLARAQIREGRLQTVKELALDTYMTLSRKVTEATIAAQDTTRDVRLASLATPPQHAAFPRTLLNVAIAGVVGLLIGALAALAIEYWQRGRPDRIDVG